MPNIHNQRNRTVKVEILDMQNVDLSSVDYIPKTGKEDFGLIINVAGDVKLTTLDGTTDTFPLAAGIYPGGFTKVFKTGTTATGIVAYY